MLAIEYVGKKPIKHDNVAGTSLTWTPGQVHVVSGEVADKLLKHPGIWAISALDFDLDTKPAGLPKLVEEKQEFHPLVVFDINEATKEQLNEFATREFGKRLDLRHNKDKLRDEVRLLVEGRKINPVIE